MNSFERRNKIVDLVNAQGSVMVLDLSNMFGISEVTIRTDLRLLEEKGWSRVFTVAQQGPAATWQKAKIRKWCWKTLSTCKRPEKRVSHRPPRP
jgi:predicted ArsR family transcriptional regulator